MSYCLVPFSFTVQNMEINVCIICECEELLEDAFVLLLVDDNTVFITDNKYPHGESHFFGSPKKNYRFFCEFSNLKLNLQTSLAQELDQTVGDRETRITELTDEVEQLTSQLTEQQKKLDQLQSDKAALEADLQQRDEDLSQVAPVL